MNTKELQEAITLMNEHPKTMVYQRTVIEAAQKLLSLYPLLEELCEARDKLPFIKNFNHVSTCGENKVFADGDIIIGYGFSKKHRTHQHFCNFITTAANTTNQIRKVLDE